MKTLLFIKPFLILIVALFIALPYGVEGGEYLLIDLGTLGGSESYAQDVNDSRQVTGRSQIASGDAHAFIWNSQQGMQDIGTLGGANSNGLGINNNGEVTGWSQIASSGASHAFYYDGNAMHDLGAMSGINSGGQGINDNASISGTIFFDNDTHQALVLQ